MSEEEIQKRFGEIDSGEDGRKKRAEKQILMKRRQGGRPKNRGVGRYGAIQLSHFEKSASSPTPLPQDHLEIYTEANHRLATATCTMCIKVSRDFSLSYASSLP
jgi:hypothetical protein